MVLQTTQDIEVENCNFQPEHWAIVFKPKQLVINKIQQHEKQSAPQDDQSMEEDVFIVIIWQGHQFCFMDDIVYTSRLLGR